MSFARHVDIKRDVILKLFRQALLADRELLFHGLEWHLLALAGND